jgi:two-component sensor histidine kinase
MLSVLTRSLRWIIPAPISHSFRMYVRHNGNTNRCKELATIHANVPVALLLVDEHLRVERVNRLAAQIAGQDAADLLEHRHGALGCLDALSDPSRCGNGPSCSECSFRLAILDTVLHGKRYESLEAWVPVDASPQPERRCLLVSTAPLAFKEQTKALVSAQDITPLKRAEQDLRDAKASLEAEVSGKTVLLKEVHHRVKNNLAVISSLLNMKAEITDDGPAKVALEDSQRRVHSIALIHEHLYAGEHFDRINFAEYAQQFAQVFYSAFSAESARIAINMDIDPIDLRLLQAVPAALILNELLTNAFKHAFPDGRSGEIRITFREPAPGVLELAVEDDGIGSEAVLVERKTKSLGLQIVRILTAQLGGSLKQDPGSGTRLVLRFPDSAAAKTVQ